MWSESTSSGSCEPRQDEEVTDHERRDEMPFSPMEEILEDIKAGKMVIVCDDEDRENEGDLTMAAELVTADDINFMATHGRGLICLPMAEELVDRLDIPQMTVHNSSRMGTGFTVSIEARDGHHHRHLRRRPGPHLPRGRRRRDRPRGPGHARARLSRCGRKARRRPAARRADRGGRGPLAARGLEAGRRDLRDHERGRHDGPGAGPREVLRGARRQDGDDGPDHRVPPRLRDAGHVRRGDDAAHARSASSA